MKENDDMHKHKRPASLVISYVFIYRMFGHCHAVQGPYAEVNKLKKKEGVDYNNKNYEFSSQLPANSNLDFLCTNTM